MASLELSVLLPPPRTSSRISSSKDHVSRVKLARQSLSKTDKTRRYGFVFPATAAAAATFLNPNLALAAAAAATTTSGDILDPSVAKLAINVLGPALASFNVLFIARIVMSWYPNIPVDKVPFVIAYAPTEPVLAPTRKLIQPIGGVDMAPVAWFAVLSLLNEVLLGQQGLLVVLAEQR